MLQKLLLIFRTVKTVCNFANPNKRIYCKFIFGTLTFPIGPVSCHTCFCYLVHFLCPNLNFNYFSITSRNSRVQRSITITFRLTYIIFKTSWNCSPSLMYGAKRSITINLIFSNYTKSIDI